MVKSSRARFRKRNVNRVSSLHRGLAATDLPGKNVEKKLFTFALFRRGHYPPSAWKIPDHLEGDDLKAALHEGARKSVVKREKHPTQPSAE